MEIDLTNFFTWNYLSGVLVVFTAVEMFFGAVILRYGHESVMDFMGGLDDNLSGSHEYCKE